MKKLQLKRLTFNLRTISQLESVRINGRYPTGELTEGAQCASKGCGDKSKRRICYQY